MPSGIGKASIHLEKWSIKVNRYMFIRGVTKYGPVISMDVTSKGMKAPPFFLTAPQTLFPPFASDMSHFLTNLRLTSAC